MENTLISKYLKINCWHLFLLNIMIYAIMIFVEYRFIQTDNYYSMYLKPLFSSADDYQKAISEAKFYELYNYLWIPVHIAIQAILISICLFIGYNALNYFISFKNSVKATCQSIIIFSLNSLLVTSLKAGGVIEYNAKTVDDEFFFQSLGRLFVNQDLPNIIYRLLEKVNFVEVIFILVLSSILSKILVVNLMRTILLTLGIYLFGTIIYICFMYFIELLFN